MNRHLLLAIIILSPFLAFTQATPLPAITSPSTTNTVGVDSPDAEVVGESDIPVVELSETEVGEDGGGTQNVASALNASRDPFVSASSFTFSSARFRIRGYDSKNFTTYMNGVPMNDLENGRATWGQWGGLNAVQRNRDNTLGLQPTTFAYGEPGGALLIDTRASKQRKQFEVSYANANRNYRHRVMATYSTGLLKHGWAVSASVSRRWAKEGYVPGTFYDGTSYFLSVEKFFGNQHSLSLTGFGSSVRTGGAAATTQEMYNLAGSHYYNFYWGWQDGKKRNSNVRNVHQPTFLLNHEWKITNKQSLVTAAGFSFGKIQRTMIDFYNAANPRPDYYRNLPSYIQDSIQRDLVQNAYHENPDLLQTDWEGFYEANALSVDSVKNANGGTETVVGKRARYVVQNQVQDSRKFNLSSTYNNALNDHIGVTAGVTYQFSRSEYYAVVDDLLGADFYVDVNQFAERDFPDSFSVAQNDVNRPNRILHEGDKYSYDYFITNHKASLWGQALFKYNHIDFYIAGDFAVNSYWRNGKTRYGLQSDNSYGKSAVKIFPNGGVKAGVTYKINGSNYLYLNGAFENRAASSRDAFVSARTQNGYVGGLKNESIYSGELGYIYRTAIVKLRANMFFTQFNNETQLRRFYHDDFRTFINYSLTGVNTRHWGAEFGLEAKVYRGFSVTAAASVGRYTYTSRPTATITYDNNPTLNTVEKVYAKNFNVGGTPQLATTVGINYRAPQFWFAGINFNYYDWMWTSINPARRTEGAVDLVDPASTNFESITTQERLKGQFTMDVSLGYSWLLNNQFKNLKKRYFLVFNANINNVTNNRNLVTTGYEQLRFDYNSKNANKFPSRYYYGYGTTYFVSVAFRMQ
ncbi:MAG: hypothetical protein KA149_02715 [Chitinophagales bacterium]|nr:hypothetical protein [Chitinophagales bacterium]